MTLKYKDEVVGKEGMNGRINGLRVKIRMFKEVVIDKRLIGGNGWL